MERISSFWEISGRRRSPERGRRELRRERPSSSPEVVGSKQKRRGRQSPRRSAESSSSLSSHRRRTSRRKIARPSHRSTGRSLSRSPPSVMSPARRRRSRSIRQEDSEKEEGDGRRRKKHEKRSSRRRQHRRHAQDHERSSRHRRGRSNKKRKRRRRARSSTPSSSSSASSSQSSSSFSSTTTKSRSRSLRRDPAQARRAGVVSDDEPAYGGSGINLNNVPSNRTNLTYHSTTKSNKSLPFSDTLEPRKETQSNHQQQQQQLHHHRYAPAHATAAHSDTSKQRRDDTVGHFDGGKGTIIADRYKIIRQVGLGTFGRVVECLDLKRHQHQPPQNPQQPHQYHQQQRPYLRGGGEPFVALKIVRKIKRYYESALIEARIVQDLNRRGGRGRTHCVLLYDAFSLDGHYCMVFESLGPSLFDFLKQHDYQPFPMVCVQDFAVQLLQTMEFLHSFSLIHTDLKIENILLMNDREVTYCNQRVPESTRIKLIDFGGACYDSDKKSSIINTRQYRAPEVILGTGWSMPSDMWSVGCILMELYMGELLFATHDNVEHLALMERIIGPFPRRMIQDAKHGNSTPVRELALRAFDSTERHRMDRVLDADNAMYVRQSPRLESLIGLNEVWFLDLLRMILVLDPRERATAHDCLQFLSRIRRNEVRYG